MEALKTRGTTAVPESVLAAARRDFTSERVDDKQTVETIKKIYISTPNHYVLDPHTSVGVTAAQRLVAANTDKDVHFVALSTAHPAKFRAAVDQALGEQATYDFDGVVRPKEFYGLEERERRVRVVERPDAELVREAVEDLLAREGKA